MSRATQRGCDGWADNDDTFRSAADGDVLNGPHGGLLVGRILCPIDFSEASRVALRYAAALAKCYDAEIRALHVVDVTLTEGAAEPSWDCVRAARSEARVELRRRFQEFLAPAEAVGVLAKADIQEGCAVEQILDQAASGRADVIVMGTKGLSGIKRRALGSTAEQVLRSALCPVLTVRPHAYPTPPSDHALFSRILCPVKLSDPSAKAVTLALALAQEVNGRLILLHALDHFVARPGVEYIGLDEQLWKQFLELERDARHRLRQLIPRDARAWCHPEEGIVTADSPVRAILQVAHDDRAELIVMSVRARGGIDRILFGSTTQAVIRQAPCPVLTVRAT